MIDQHRFEELYEACGGVFRTTVLIQKRLKELHRGWRQLVDGIFRNPIEAVIQEITTRRIELIPDTDENRKLIADEMERMTLEARPLFEVTEEMPEEEIEARLGGEKKR